jgi:branched-chain amino acid aminotransferase
VFDRGLLYGDGCFEVLRTWDGVARDLDAHLDRLFDTARFLALKTIERGKLVEAIFRTIGAATSEHVVDHRIRIVLTRGPGTLAQPAADLGPGRAIVIVEPLPPQPVGLAAAVVDWPLPRRGGRGHKTLAYLDHIIANQLARAANADEALRLDARGNVAEGGSSNVFIVTNTTVATPPPEHGELPGIVRGRVLALCAGEQLTAIERTITPRDLRNADELFVTSSLRGVVAITRLDGVERPAGPITARLSAAYARVMRASR